MKTGSLFFFCISLLLLSINAYGQKVSINSKTFKQQAGVHLKFTYMLSELGPTPKGPEIVDQFRLIDGILKADLVNLQEDKADLILITNPKDFTIILQKALLKMGFEWVYVDDIKVKTIELFQYLEQL